MIIVEGRLVFVHVHRTGGQYVAAFLRQHLSVEEIGYHYPIGELPPRCSDLPVVGFVRNPWDWYVSWHEFNRAAPRNPLFRWLSNHGRNPFAETLRQLLRLGSDDRYFAALREAIAPSLPRSLEGNRGAGLLRSDLATMSPERGYFSWLFERMMGPAPRYVGRFERLEEDVLDLVSEHGVEVTAEMREHLRRCEPVNASRRGPYRDYYDDALAEEVAVADRVLIERYGYAF